jgi:hypothetical protein
MMQDPDLNSMAKDLKVSWQAWQKRRFIRRGKYVLDRWLFQLGMFLVFFWLWFVAHSYNYSMDYYKCEMPAGTAVRYVGSDTEYSISQAEGCENPFYNPDIAWKTYQYLPPGEYGTKLDGPLWQSVFYVPLLAIAVFGGLNHIIHNRRSQR